MSFLALTLLRHPGEVAAFLELALPSFLSPGNLGTWEPGDVYRILAPRDSADRIRRCAALQRAGGLRVEVLDAQARPYRVEAGEVLCLLPPEVVLAEGWLHQLRGLWAMGKRMVLGASLPVVAEAVRRPLLEKGFQADRERLVLSPRDMLGCVLSHRSADPGLLIRQVAPGALLARALQPEVFLVALRGAGDLGPGLEDPEALARAFRFPEELFVLHDSDQGLRLRLMEAPEAEASTPLARAAQAVGRPCWPVLAEVAIRWYEAPLQDPEIWGAAEGESLARAQDVLAAFAALSRFPALVRDLRRLEGILAGDPGRVLPPPRLLSLAPRTCLLLPQGLEGLARTASLLSALRGQPGHQVVCGVDQADLLSGFQLQVVDWARFAAEAAYREAQCESFQAYGAQLVLNADPARFVGLDLLACQGRKAWCVTHQAPEGVEARLRMRMEEVYTHLLPREADLGEVLGLEPQRATLWPGEEAHAEARQIWESLGWDPARTLLVLSAAQEAALSRALEEGWNLLGLGGREVAAPLERLLGPFGERAANLAGALALPVQAALMAEAGAFAGEDSPLASLARILIREKGVTCEP